MHVKLAVMLITSTQKRCWYCDVFFLFHAERMPILISMEVNELSKIMRPYPWRHDLDGSPLSTWPRRFRPRSPWWPWLPVSRINQCFILSVIFLSFQAAGSRCVSEYTKILYTLCGLYSLKFRSLSSFYFRNVKKSLNFPKLPDSLVW